MYSEFQCWMWHLLLLSTWISHSWSGLQWPTLWPAFPSSVSLWGKSEKIQQSEMQKCNSIINKRTIIDYYAKTNMQFLKFLVSLFNLLLIDLSSQWLRGLSTSRQSFSIVFGECPYCSKVIFNLITKTQQMLNFKKSLYFNPQIHVKTYSSCLVQKMTEKLFFFQPITVKMVTGNT